MANDEPYASRRADLYDETPTGRVKAEPPEMAPQGDDNLIAAIGHLIPVLGGLLFLLKSQEPERLSPWLEFQLKQATIMFLWVFSLLIAASLLLKIFVGWAVWAFRLLFWPIYCSIAAYNAYKGHTFRYILISDIVEKYWMKQR